jgi:hypothetical protein
MTLTAWVGFLYYPARPAAKRWSSQKRKSVSPGLSLSIGHYLLDVPFIRSLK